MKLAVVGAGYVGLVTAVCLAEMGNMVISIDNDCAKVATLEKGTVPFYEPGLEELMKKAINEGKLLFSVDLQEGLRGAECVFIAVGTPPRSDGRADLGQVLSVVESIGRSLNNDTTVILKSTVPVGTNDKVREILLGHTAGRYHVDVVSNPEFLREGSAISDTFQAERIVIGCESSRARSTMDALYKPFGIPIIYTSIRTAEMIKYASNAFLATKISFINEIANLCERTGADVTAVSQAMGMDTRIGNKFLSAGIGYGGSCFPKDTNALLQLAGDVEYDFELLKAVISINNYQRMSLLYKLRDFYKDDLPRKRIAILGMAFKPNTDDVRESAAVLIADHLKDAGCSVIVYDPKALQNAKRVLGDGVEYSDDLGTALRDADCALICTDWNEIKTMKLSWVKQIMKEPVIFDGRNCFSVSSMLNEGYCYISVGRTPVMSNMQSLSVV